VAGLLPTETESALAGLLAAGDEGSLRKVLEIEPGNEAAVVALAELLVARRDDGDVDEALALLARIPESDATRRVAAVARIGVDTKDDITAELDTLLERVKEDDAARQRYLDLLEVMGADDPRTSGYRKQLTNRLF